MNGIERAYLSGFLKSANGFGTNLGELLGKVHVPELEKLAPATTPITTQATQDIVHQAPEIAERTGLNSLEPTSVLDEFNQMEQPVDPKWFKGINRQNNIKNFVQPIKNSVNSTMNQIGNMPLGKATLIGGGLGASAHFGGQALGTLTGPNQHENILRDPQTTQAAVDKLHKPLDPLESLYSKLKDHVANHKLLYGGGALGLAGLSGLGYLHSNKHQHKHPNEQDLSQPGGPEELSLQ